MFNWSPQLSTVFLLFLVFAETKLKRLCLVKMCLFNTDIEVIDSPCVQNNINNSNPNNITHESALYHFTDF